MSRRKYSCSKWTLVLLLVLVCNNVNCRPQETATASAVTTIQVENKLTESNDRLSSTKSEATVTNTTSPNDSRNVKNKGPHIRDSIKLVATQLLEDKNKTLNTPVIDTRIPPKIKNHVQNKNKIKTRNEDAVEKFENSHAGIAVPVTMEELENEHSIPEITSESSTLNEGISTWVLVSNPEIKEKVLSSTEPLKTEEVTKKPKPTNKNKTKRPQNNANKPAKRPIIAGLNKSDLIAGGSAINDNVLNKIKDTVLTNVQKNKISHKTTTQKTTTLLTTTEAPVIEVVTTKKESATKSPNITPLVKVTSKPSKKKNKIKLKVTTTTEAPIESDSALLPMEPKEQEIELEISTPATTTKKPKKSSTKRKKNKTKKRKTTKPKQEVTTKVKEVKTSNKTKTAKPAKKPDNPITSQIYNYLSREVMPSVGVGVIGLAGLVGLASYFLYPFATPVRRTFEVDKKDDIYRHNAEEYAIEGNGQAEEEMLGTVLAGMPAHAKNKLNPYAGQMAYVNRYNAKKEQDLRYRHVASAGYDSPNYNVRYPQQKTGIAHGAVHTQTAGYNPQLYDSKNSYTTEAQYAYEKSDYTPYQPVEPIFAAPQPGTADVSGYANDASNTVVYGVQPSAGTDFKPVYPFEGQVFSETTNSPQNYASTSLYLGSNKEPQEQEEIKYDEEEMNEEFGVDNKFVVGNVPKELSDTATPAVVPEHGPRNLRRRKRAAVVRKRHNYVGTIEEILKEANEKHKDIFLSNELDERLSIGDQSSNTEIMSESDIVTLNPKNPAMTNEENTKMPAYLVDTTNNDEEMSTLVDKIIESVSTVPLNSKNEQKNTKTEVTETTTKEFRVYEVFSTAADDPQNTESHSSPLVENQSPKSELTTSGLKANTETTTELRSETTSTILPSISPVFDNSSPDGTLTSVKPTDDSDEITYPPPINTQGRFWQFVKSLIEFKLRLGMTILQKTSESLNRYLRSIANNES